MNGIHIIFFKSNIPITVYLECSLKAQVLQA